MRKMVRAWVSNIPDVLELGDHDWVDEASFNLPFSWFEDHFKFFSLSSSGLKPATREEINRVLISGLK